MQVQAQDQCTMAAAITATMAITTRATPRTAARPCVLQAITTVDTATVPLRHALQTITTITSATQPPLTGTTATQHLPTEALTEADTVAVAPVAAEAAEVADVIVKYPKIFKKAMADNFFAMAF